MNYRKENNKYIVDDGYAFRNIKSGSISTVIYLAKNATFDDYEVIVKPEEPEEEVIESEIPELTLEERLATIEAGMTDIQEGLVDTNDRIEFVEDCLIEMSETVYG